MFERESSGWRADAKWIIAVLLVVTLAAFIPTFSFSQLSARHRALPILERVLQLTLLPVGGDDLTAGVRSELGFEPGQPLELLPRTGSYVETDALADLQASEALELMASDLSERVLRDGAPAALTRFEDSDLERQLRLALAGPATELVRATLVTEMLPAGLDNGRRLANWQLQARQNPGQPVQPIVGIFVRVPPDELANMNARQIGERVVTGLADLVLSDGLDAAKQAVTNRNLLARLEGAVLGPIQSRLEQLFAVVLLSTEEVVAERLESARTALQAESERAEAPTLGVAGGEELAGLSREEANELVLLRLAERAYSRGGAAALAAVSESEQAGALARVVPLLDALSASAHARYLRLTWLLGIAAVLLLIGLVFLSRGWGRLANPGAALALSAAAGALLFVRAAELFGARADVSLPVSMRAQGAIGYLLELFGYVAARMPESAGALLVRNHLALLSAGVVLVLLSLVLRLFQALRPRRRTLL